MQRQTPYRTLLSVATLAGVATQSLNAGAQQACPEEQAPALNCPDGNVRQPGSILITGNLGSGLVGVVSVDPAGTEADVFVHSSWSGHDIGNIHPVPHSPKEQFVLTGIQGSYGIHRLDQCGQTAEVGYGGLAVQGQYKGFAVDSASGDLIVSSQIEKLHTADPPQPPRHEYFRIAADGSGFSTFTTELDSLVYEGADSRVSGAMTYDSQGTLWQSGYGQESLTSITHAQLLQDVPQESFHRVGVGRGLNALGYDGRYLWGSAALGAPELYRIDPQGPAYARTLWYTADFATELSNGNDTRGVTVDPDGNPWVITFDNKLVKLGKDSPDTVLKVIDLKVAVPEFSSAFALGVYGVNPAGIEGRCNGLGCSVSEVGKTTGLSGLSALGLGLVLFGLARRRRFSAME